MSQQVGGGVGGSKWDRGKIRSENELIMGLSEFSAANWHKLGVALSISDDTLKIFQANHMGTIGVDRCLSATLAHWYKNTTGGTWGDICAALFAIDERALARKVAKNHGCSPVIVKHPESRNVALGEKEVTFKCEADGTRPLEYSWKFNGQLMATDKTLTLNNIDRNQEGKYYCHVKNNYDSTTSSAELIIGCAVTEDSMIDFLQKSGVQDTDWLLIAKKLELTTQIQAEVFLKAWKDSDADGPSWIKLAKALKGITGDWYERASEQAEKNEGHNFTLAEMRGIFKGGVREPDWQTVSNKLKLNLHGQVSVVEFYQAWCKLGPSWENLSLALGKLQGYQRVIEQVKKKADAGQNFTLAEMCGIFKGGVREPDWQTVSNKLKLNLRGQVSVVEFYQAWCKLGPSWENLSLALGKLQGYQPVMEQVKKKADLELNSKTVNLALSEAGIQLPNWKIIGEKLGVQLKGHITASTLLKEWKMQKSGISWEKLAKAIDIEGYQSAVIKAKQKKGQELSADAMCQVFNEAHIRTPNWEIIGNQLGLQVEGEISAADFLNGWYTQDCKPSWTKLAGALEKIQQTEYKQIAKNVREKQAHEICKESMVAAFSVHVPEDWREIGQQLCLNLKGELSAADFFKGWSEHTIDNKKPSWERLAGVLKTMDGYWPAARSAREKAPVEMNEGNMSIFFSEVDEVNWHSISQNLHLKQEWINGSCLRHTLTKWHSSTKGDPWSTWRKLAIVAESVYGSHAGQKLRKLAGVALKLDADNMGMVLNEAIKEANWKDVTEALGLSPGLFEGWYRRVKSGLGFDDWKNILSKWKEQEIRNGGYISWSKLADALQEKYGVDSSQKILEISGEGGSPTIKKHPDDKNGAVGKSVTFECQATGAVPLIYSWMHDGVDMPARKKSTLVVTVKKDSRGQYSCRVQNDFGSTTSNAATLTVGAIPQVEHIHTDPPGKQNIETGGTLKIICKATGDPQPKYSWRFSSEATGTSAVLSNENDHILVIKDAKVQDEGSYHCRVTNNFGDDESHYINIKVGDPPTIEKFAIEGTTKSSFRIKEEVVFYCEAKGTPPLTYIWLCNSEVIGKGLHNKWTVTAKVETEGMYQCKVENLFGSKPSEGVEIKVGESPQIDAHPKIHGLVEPGDFLRLECKASGKDHLSYVWQHDNQTMINETMPELTIMQVKESDQGTYRCCVTNRFGYVLSNDTTLNLTITQEQLMEELAPNVATRWYMLAVLLNIPKPILDKISKSFIANGNALHSLSEVLEAWLEEINASNSEVTHKSRTKASNVVTTGEPSRYWLEIYHVVKRMGHVTFARHLDKKHNLLIDRHSGQESAMSSEDQPSNAEPKPAPVNANDLQRKFTALIDKVQPLLATPDADPTESVSTSESATDTSINKCQAYLHLINFPQEQIDKISDPQSLFRLLTQYLNFQRFHVLEMIVGLFKNEEAKRKTQKYHDVLKVYQSQVDLGTFVQAIEMQTHPDNPTRECTINPTFMRPFSLQLESKWATCSIKDLKRLLTRLLPKSISRSFVWFCKASRVPDDNSISLEYVVPLSIVDNIQKEAKKKQGVLGSAGILKLSIDDDHFRPKEIVGDERAETFLRGLERVLPRGRLFQRELFPTVEVDKDQSEVEDSPPEKSDIEKLQESLQEREEREAELKQALELAETDMLKNREELETVKAEVEGVKTKLQELKGKVTEKTREVSTLKGTVNQHSSDIEKTPLLIEQASKDLKIKLQEEENRRSVFQENTTKKFGQVQSNIRSEVKTHMKAQIPELQHHVKEELEKTAQQLRDEMKKELSEMRCEVLRQHEEREERHLRRNESAADELRREISFLRQKLDEFERRQIWEIVRERQEISGGGKGDKS